MHISNKLMRHNVSKVRCFENHVIFLTDMNQCCWNTDVVVAQNSHMKATGNKKYCYSKNKLMTS
jgi:hypothetical protein